MPAHPKPSHEKTIHYSITLAPHLTTTWEQLKQKHGSYGKTIQHLINYYTENETTALNTYPLLEKYIQKLTTQINNGQPITENQLDSIRRLLTRKGENEYKQYLQTQNTNTTT